jgi:hypothetical protein
MAVAYLYNDMIDWSRTITILMAVPLNTYKALEQHKNIFISMGKPRTASEKLAPSRPEAIGEVGRERPSKTDPHGPSFT